MNHKFQTIHWGISGWTILASGIALGSTMLAAITLGLLAQSQHNLDQALVTIEAHAYELRMVPSVARLCQAYWRLEQVTGVMGSDERQLCQALINQELPLTEEFQEYSENRRDSND